MKTAYQSKMKSKPTSSDNTKDHSDDKVPNGHTHHDADDGDIFRPINQKMFKTEPIDAA